MKIEKEWRQTLQEDLQKEKDVLSHLRNETQQIISLKKVNSGKIFKFYILTNVNSVVGDGVSYYSPNSL